MGRQAPDDRHDRLRTAERETTFDDAITERGDGDDGGRGNDHRDEPGRGDERRDCTDPNEGAAMTTPGNPQADDPLAGVDLFAGLAPAVRSRVAAAAVPRSYRRGQLLFLERDPGDSLIMVRRGAVSVFRTAPTGDRALLYVVRPPGVLGELALLDGGSRSASAEALEETHVLALSRGAFLELVRTQPPILDGVMRSFGGLIRRLTDQTSDHIFLDLPGRVAKTLIRLVGDNRSPVVTIDLNQTQLAEMAGGSRQSVNQALGTFATRGWLHTEGRKIVVTDIPALRRRAGMT